jgi:RNA polymerase sigma-70 factor, ECF subfamily
MATSDPDPLEPTEELVHLAQQGGRAAFDSLIRRSQPELVRLVRARLGARLRQMEDTADLVQSALTEAVRDLPQFEYRGKGSFLRWLSTIVEHKLRHHARDLMRARRDPDRVEPLSDVMSATGARPVRAGEPSPSDVAAGHELEARYLAALAQLPELERELVMMRLELHCEYSAIAAALSLGSADAVRKRLARVLARLEALMSGSAP